jgi:hypothetical protein
MPCFEGIFQGGGYKFLTRQFIKSFWTPLGSGNFISHRLEYNPKGPKIK